MTKASNAPDPIIKAIAKGALNSVFKSDKEGSRKRAKSLDLLAVEMFSVMTPEFSRNKQIAAVAPVFKSDR